MRKDAFAILSKSDLAKLLGHARETDREFVARLERFPLVRLRIRYEEVDPIRRRRMEQLLAAVARLLQTPWRGMRAAARACYGRAEFETRVRDHLRLYAAEVHALTRSVRPALLVLPWRSRLRALMDDQADALAREVADLLYDRAMR